MKEILVVLTCGAFAVAALVSSKTPSQKQAAKCRCDCYWQGKEDGRNEVRNADAERRAARSRGDELPEFMNREGWSPNMPDVN